MPDMIERFERTKKLKAARSLDSRLVRWARNLAGLEVAVGADDDFISLVVLGAEAGDLDAATGREQRWIHLHRGRQEDLHFGARPAGCTAQK